MSFMFPYSVVFPPPIHLDMSSSSYLSDIPSSCSSGLWSPSSEIRFLAILSIEICVEFRFFNRLECTQHHHLLFVVLLLLVMLLIVFHGLLSLDSQLISFSWLSLLVVVLGEAIRVWMMSLVRWCSVIGNRFVQIEVYCFGEGNYSEFLGFVFFCHCALAVWLCSCWIV